MFKSTLVGMRVSPDRVFVFSNTYKMMVHTTYPLLITRDKLITICPVCNQDINPANEKTSSTRVYVSFCGHFNDIFVKQSNYTMGIKNYSCQSSHVFLQLPILTSNYKNP